MKMHGFPKADHICKKNDFQLLFSEGNVSYHYPLKLLYRLDSNPDSNPESNPESGVKVAVVVSKKIIHHAVDRNRLKRLMRESFRLNRQMLSEFSLPESGQLHLLFLYSGHSMHDFPTIEYAVKKLINNILKNGAFIHIKKKD